MRKEISEKIISSLTLIHSQNEYQQLLNTLGQLNKPIILSYINAHAYNLLYDNPDFKNDLFQSDIILRDGIGMAILLRFLKISPGINMNGTDFNLAILKEYSQIGTVLIGTTDRNLTAAKLKLGQQGIKILGMMNGFQTHQTYLTLLQSTRPRIILLGMGMPRQESLSFFLKNSLDFPCLIINGGAVIDFLSGYISRAPAWVRAIHCEWIYRLLLEPKRLWKRYLIGNIKFLWRAIPIMYNDT